jgi:hypothetical protein
MGRLVAWMLGQGFRRRGLFRVGGALMALGVVATAVGSVALDNYAIGACGGGLALTFEGFGQSACGGGRRADAVTFVGLCFGLGGLSLLVSGYA